MVNDERNKLITTSLFETHFDSYLPLLPPFTGQWHLTLLVIPKVAADLRSSIWKQMSDAGIKYIPSNTFSYYDQVLDTTAMLGAVPSRYNWNGGEIGFDTYFSMARGNASVPAMEMTKWFDTNYHFIVPELRLLELIPYQSLLAQSATYCCQKPAKGVEKTFDLLSLLDKILPIYKEVIAELKEAGATWIQFDEATLVKDLEGYQLEAFTKAYSELESACSGLNVIVATYFADVPAEAFKTLTSLPGVAGFTFDLIRGEKTLELIKSSFPSGKYLFAGVVMEGTSGLMILLVLSLSSSLSRAMWAKISLWFRPLAHSFTLLSILLMRPNWMMKSNHGLRLLLRRLLKSMHWPRL
ncbi:unnamed protein product [Lactuca virosa]|uniref:Cobalamin-independent methionine synthase MetE N-terminal domain-containing protein n=1 Tax=Lactuca virosa TaxID=75947 RepID=A0AAU9NK15_9ASTR|nr:unnamed protein product [Lactuca virosa]